MQRLCVGLVLLLLLPGLCVAGIVSKWLLGVQSTLLSTELVSIPNNGYTVAGPIYNNVVGGAGGDGYTFCDVEGVFVFTGNPTANSAVVVWLLTAPDGTNYETTPTATVALGRPPDVVLPVTTGQTGTRVTRLIRCPWGLFRAVARNDGTGFALAASGNLIRIRPVTLQGIAQ